MNLVIVESPAKCKTIQSYLGDGWQVEASFGHVRDLPINDLGVSMDDMTPQYTVTEKGRRTISKLKRLANDADCVWLATDPDREGEAIAWHLKKALGLKDPKRIFFNEITRDKVISAIQSPQVIDMDKVDAQQARRILDRLVGYQVSPALCNSVNQNGLSAGRVQSVAVRLVVDREREIEAFVPTNHFGVEVKFKGKEGEWAAKWDVSRHVSEDSPYITDRSVAENVCLLNKMTVSSVDTSDFKRFPPSPFITTTLQKAASISLGMSASKTMSDAQVLFDAGLITYHRTDNPNLSDEGAGIIRNFLIRAGHKEHIPENRNKWKSKDGAQEAHEAIRPTDVELKDPEVNASALALYKLIRQRSIASQMKASTYETKTIILTSGVDVKFLDKEVCFIAKSKVMTYPGWTLLTSSDSAEEAEDDEKGSEIVLPCLTEGDVVSPFSRIILELKTKAPKRYTEAALIGRLEKEGIGRPSTYASIIENITRRNYIEERKKTFVPLSSGKIVVDALTNRFDFMEVGFTRTLEGRLDSIAAGDEGYFAVVKSFYDLLSQNLSVLSACSLEVVHNCPKCEVNQLRRIKKNDGYFWGCKGYPECDGVMQDQDGMPVDSIVSGYSCPSCSGNLIRRKNSGKAGFWWGCGNWREGCKFTTEDKGGKPAKVYPCPSCGERLRQTGSGDKKHWYCSGYKSGCKIKMDDSRGRPVKSTANEH